MPDHRVHVFAYKYRTIDRRRILLVWQIDLNQRRKTMDDSSFVTRPPPCEYRRIFEEAQRAERLETLVSLGERRVDCC